MVKHKHRLRVKVLIIQQTHSVARIPKVLLLNFLALDFHSEVTTVTRVPLPAQVILETITVAAGVAQACIVEVADVVEDVEDVVVDDTVAVAVMAKKRLKKSTTDLDPHLHMMNPARVRSQHQKVHTHMDTATATDTDIVLIVMDPVMLTPTITDLAMDSAGDVVVDHHHLAAQEAQEACHLISLPS
jgi:hypothetical protein